MHLHVEGELELGLEIGVVDFEEAVDELAQVDVLLTLEVQHCKETLTDDAGQLGVLHRYRLGRRGLR